MTQNEPSAEVVDAVGTAIGFALCELEGDTLAHGLTLEEWHKLGRAAIAAHESPLRKELDDAWQNAVEWQRRFDGLAQHAERLAKTIEWYRDQECEGYCEGFTPQICSASTDGDCGGCRAAVSLAAYRAAYPKDESNG